MLIRAQPQSKGSGAQNSKRALLEQLDETVECIIKSVSSTTKPESLQVDDWTAKDTLGHIAFWHESFARNVRALAEGRQPHVLEGTYPDLNQRGVERSRSMSLGQIAGRIRRAQAVIRRCIVKLPADIMIPYRKGSRNYSPEEHLITVRNHIVAHMHRIEKARRRRSRD